MRMYVYNGFTSVGGAIYIFAVVPLSVWFQESVDVVGFVPAVI